MRPRLLLITLLVPALLVAACGDDDLGARPPPPEWPASIVVGLVPGADQPGLPDAIDPAIDAIAARLGIGVEAVVAPDHETLVADIAAGRVDIGVVEPFAYVLAADPDAVTATSQLARFGSFTRHGQWFTDDRSVCREPPAEATALVNTPDGPTQVSALDVDALQVGVRFDADGAVLDATTSDGTPIEPGWSCIGDLDTVAGSTVALISEDSLAGGIFPRLQLARRGITVDDGFDPLYTGDHAESVRAVYDGRTRFGVTFDDARRRIADEHPDVGERVIVFHLTDEIPHEVIVAAAELPTFLTASFQDALAAYLETGAGATLVDSTLGWTDVRSIDDTDLDAVREAVTVLGLTDPPG